MRLFFAVIVLCLSSGVFAAEAEPCPSLLDNADKPARLVRMDASEKLLRESLNTTALGFSRRMSAGQVNPGLMRAHAFKFEGLFRLFAEAKELKPRQRQHIDHLLDRLKALEDNLGWYSEPFEHIEKLQTLKNSKIVTSELYDFLLKRFTAQGEEAKARLITFLESDGWFGSPQGMALNEIDRGLEDIASLSRKNDRKTVLESISTYIKKSDKKISELARLSSLDSIQGQVHPARRWLRWVSIMFNAGNIFEFDKSPSPINQFRGVPTDPTMAKYSQLKVTGQEKEPVKINRDLFYALTNYVGELGRAKDLGEFEEAVTQALISRGNLPVTARRQAIIITSAVPGYFEPFQKAHEDFLVIGETGFLRELRREVEAGLK